MLGPLLALLMSPPAGDVASRIDLQWEAPPECPSVDDVRGRIGAYLGRDEFDDAIAEVRVRVRVEENRGAAKPWHMKVGIETPGERVEREVDAARCADTRDGAALIIAVALDPLRVSRRAPPPEDAPPPEAPSVVREAPKPAPPKRSLFVDTRVGATMEVGTAPRVAGGIAIAVALVGKRFRVEAVGRWVPPRELRPYADSPEVRVVVQSGFAGLRACFVPSVRRLELPSCAQAEAGALRGRGRGLAEPRVSHRAWIDVSLGQELVWHGRRGFGLWIAADAAVTVLRPRLVVDELGTAYAPGWVAMRVMAGPSVRW